MNPIIDLVNKKSLKKSIPDISTGDIVKVSQKIKEGNKTRAQVFEGMVISREGGNGVTASITVRKIASGIGVEKKFLLNSPNIESVKVLRSSKVRKSKIFYVRGLTGKAQKLKEKQRKMLGEIGLKEDEVVETAETTEDLAPIPVEEQENQATPDQAKPEKELSDEGAEQKVEEIAEQETPIEKAKDGENLNIGETKNEEKTPEEKTEETK